MSFATLNEHEERLGLLQRSLQRGRLGHAYLFTGPDIGVLEQAAAELAKTLNCQNPPRRGDGGLALDNCDACPSCRKIQSRLHPDVQWIRPESKSRVVTIDQMRDLMQTVHLKPTQAPWKVAVIVAADRMNPQAANAFLKTLEEPPGNSILILLSAEREQLLDTIQSRCLRLHFPGESSAVSSAPFLDWLGPFARAASEESKSLLGRYRLLSLLLNRLAAIKETVGQELKGRSPLEHHEDIDPKLRDRWEEELAAAIEAEYRHQRAGTLTGLQWWFRDVWLDAQQLAGSNLLAYPQLAPETARLAQRLGPARALDNLRQLERTQRLLHTNVQEALALEVGLLRLNLG